MLETCMFQDSACVFADVISMNLVSGCAFSSIMQIIALAFNNGHLLTATCNSGNKII